MNWSKWAEKGRKYITSLIAGGVKLPYKHNWSTNKPKMCARILTGKIRVAFGISCLLLNRRMLKIPYNCSKEAAILKIQTEAPATSSNSC